jgi:hypothetical protein
VYLLDVSIFFSIDLGVKGAEHDLCFAPFIQPPLPGGLRESWGSVNLRGFYGESTVKF